MSASEKSRLLFKVDSLSRPRRQVLEELGIPKSTYYRWRKKLERNEGLIDRVSVRAPWNRLTPLERSTVLEVGQPVSRVGQPSVGIVDHRSRRVLGLGIDRLSGPSKRRAGQEFGDQDGGEQGVPPQDNRASLDMGHRCVVLPGLRLGVLLPGYGDG